MIKTPITRFKRSNIAGFIPSDSDLAVGEIFINFADKKVYSKDDAGTIVSVGGSSTIDWNDIVNKPTLFTASYNDLTDKPSLFSGSYNDLTDKPTTDFGNY